MYACMLAASCSYIPTRGRDKHNRSPDMSVLAPILLREGETNTTDLQTCLSAKLAIFILWSFLS